MEDQILETLSAAGKPLRPGEIAELSGLNKDDVSKAIKKLKIDEKIYSPKKCFYDIKTK